MSVDRYAKTQNQMDRNKVIAIAAIVICISAVVKSFNWPGHHFASNVMRIALISGIVFLVIDRHNKTKQKENE